jgi:uncharacterized protein (TIGR01244 family)
MQTVSNAMDQATPTARSRVVDHLDSLIVDHGVFRFFYNTRRRVTPLVYRSSQPSPAQIRQAARLGIKTVVNLRGERDCGAYRLEVEACRRAGIRLVDFQLRSRAAPKRHVLRAAKALFDEIEYPVLLHCKSGADRVGLMSALYLLLREGRPVEEAARQLDWRYGHVRQARTGVLDYFLEQYASANRARPIPFMEWVETAYDYKRTKTSFVPSGWANLLVDRVLRRE